MSSVIVNRDDDEVAYSDEEQMEEQEQEQPVRQVKRAAVKTKGRGFRKAGAGDRYSGAGGRFDTMQDDDEGAADSVAQKSVEGWIVMITGVHEEAQEDDVYDLFADYGEIKQLHLNLDRRTGYVKGYALVEYESFKEASAAIEGLNGHEMLEQTLKVDWAFNKPPKKGARKN